MTLEWIVRDGVAFLDLAPTGPAGAGLYLAVRPHAEEGFFRPCAVLVAGEDERELGDGVLGAEHARDTIVKYAIQVLAAAHGVAPDLRDADEGAPRPPTPPSPRTWRGGNPEWAERAVAALWAVLEASPHTA